MDWPPQVGDLLPRAAEPEGIRYKLVTYSLAKSHLSGGAKARGFELILGITITAVDYLEDEIRRGILVTPISAIRVADPFGITCVVDCPVAVWKSSKREWLRSERRGSSLAPMRRRV